MASSAQMFRAQIGAWKAATDKQGVAMARQVCFEMAERVVLKTPVDTGFLRGSWQPSLGGPAGQGGQTDPSGGAAIAAAVLVVNGIKPGDHFYMMNNASYAFFVENGTSKMAGRFYVSDTLRSFQDVVAKVAAELGLKK